MPRFSRHAAWSTLIVAASALPMHAEVLIERTVMPHDAAASSFAIGLPGGVSFCYDPVRGGVSYAWTGGFVDISPARPGTGKLIKPAILQGEVVYRETGMSPLRFDPEREPHVQFNGYVLHKVRVVFAYTVDGIKVREEVQSRLGGGLIRTFQIDDVSPRSWWYVVDGKPPQALQRLGDQLLILETRFERTAP